MISLIPDWELNDGVVLALPHAKTAPQDRAQIVLDYACYLADSGIKVSVCAHSSSPQDILDKLIQAGIEIINLKPGDIWIRDWAPLPCKQYGKPAAVKFVYPGTYPYAPGMDNTAGRGLAAKLKLKLINSDIIWELGNFSTNGKDILVTDQVLHANNLANGEALKARLVQELDFDPDIQVFVLEVIRQDTELWRLYGFQEYYAISHIDGYMRFIDHNTIVYHQLDTALQTSPNSSAEERRFADQYMQIAKAKQQSIDRLVQTLHKSGYRTIPIKEPCVPVQQADCREGTIPDTGDYLNFLRVGYRLFLPQYEGAEYAEGNARALSQYKQAGIDVIPVNEPFINQLSQAGGVMNCAAWVNIKKKQVRR